MKLEFRRGYRVISILSLASLAGLSCSHTEVREPETTVSAEAAPTPAATPAPAPPTSARKVEEPNPTEKALAKAPAVVAGDDVKRECVQSKPATALFQGICLPKNLVFFLRCLELTEARHIKLSQDAAGSALTVSIEGKLGQTTVPAAMSAIAEMVGDAKSMCYRLARRMRPAVPKGEGALSTPYFAAEHLTPRSSAPSSISIEHLRLELISEPNVAVLRSMFARILETEDLSEDDAATLQQLLTQSPESNTRRPAGGFTTLHSNSKSAEDRRRHQNVHTTSPNDPGVSGADAVDPTKALLNSRKRCDELVDGLLLFEPSLTMRQGKSLPVFARLSRKPGTSIKSGLDGLHVEVVNEKISCRVSVSLDAMEPGAFTIEKSPPDRPDDQLIEAEGFSQWDWRVTPLRHGQLHLVLYVAPKVYVSGVPDAMSKQFKQPPRIITVYPDYLYMAIVWLKANWVLISGILGLLVIPLTLWTRKSVADWLANRKKKNQGVIVLP